MADPAPPAPPAPSLPTALSTAAVPSVPRVLVTDFDGTLYRGDDPIRHYAGLVADGLAVASRRALLDGVDVYLAEGAPGSAVPEAVDGWEAVAAFGLRLGADRGVLDAAFAATRRYMLLDDCALEVPAGYAELLTRLRAEGVRVVLATNSPAEGLDSLLRRLDVLPLVDEVTSGVGKPAGLRRLLRRELDRTGTEPPRLLVIGDHWRNDVAPGVEVGATTAYIDRFGRADGPADAVAATVEGLLDSVRFWAAAQIEEPASKGN